jgi:hypothetical protein
MQQHSAHRRSSGGKNIWGAIVQLPKQLWMPAFCYDEKNGCKEVSKICEPRSCLGPDACYFDGFCYYIDRQLGAPYKLQYFSLSL